MCLIRLNVKETKKLQKANKVLICYKVVKRSNTKIYPFYKLSYAGPYHIGENTSDRDLCISGDYTKLTREEKRKKTVDHGFHVFKTERAALHFLKYQRHINPKEYYFTYEIIKVKCHTKDLIAIGYNVISYGLPKVYGKSMVFNKITI